MRNPNWHRDEIILALDLHFSPNRGSIHDKNPKIIQLSKILNDLPIFTYRPDCSKFRNINGVTLKLSNFLAVDPTYIGNGMKRGSKLDEQIFNEFFNDRDRLKILASEIKRIALSDSVKSEILSVEEDEQTRNDSVREGQIIYRLHKTRERDRGIVKSKKEQAL